MNNFQIRDKVSLRQFAADLATRALPTAYGFTSKATYDINDHIAIAKAIEKYIEGNSKLPEYEDFTKSASDIFKSIYEGNLNKDKDKYPNFQVKEQD